MNETTPDVADPSAVAGIIFLTLVTTAVSAVYTEFRVARGWPPLFRVIVSVLLDWSALGIVCTTMWMRDTEIKKIVYVMLGAYIVTGFRIIPLKMQLQNYHEFDRESELGEPILKV